MKNVPLETLQQSSENTMVAHLGITFTEVGEDYLCATMPVNERTSQPMGILHGGASVVLAETLGSVGSAALVDANKYAPVGLEINANHIRPVPKGQLVYGKATAVHIGRKTHIWEIRLTNEAGKLTCISRLTIAIVTRE